MRNPIRSEAAAYRFVWLTIGYFALIVIGSVINVWVGVAVFVVLTVGLLWWVLARREGDAPPTRQRPAPSPPGEHRLLVVAAETVRDDDLVETIRRHVAGRNARVLVVSPALNSPLRHLASDVDQAIDTARERLDASLAALRVAGVDAEGEVGDSDPVQAIEDALRTFRPDEIVLATHADGQSPWLEQGVVDKARARFAVPVTHVTAGEP